MANQASAELFLDILTKEEKEALLSKKMEEIRKKNEALRKRHEEIQKDKKVADQMTKDKADASLTKEKQSFPNDKQHNDKPKKNTGKPVGRGKPRPKSGGDFNHVQSDHQFKHETPKRFSFGEHDRPTDFRFGEHDDRDADHNSEGRSPSHRNFLGRNGDHYNRQDHRSDGNFRKSGDSRGRGRGRNFYDRQESRSSGEENFRSDSRGNQSRGNQSKRSGNRYSGEFNRNSGEFNRHRDQREQYDDAEYDGKKKRPYGGSHYHDDRAEGPPPDPAYNFLSDRAREGLQQNQDRREPHRRHPKNFGGQDFSNVKNQMKNVKERQQQNRSGPPKSKMELAVTMSGKERRQYIEWKADRDRVDNARIERQKSSSGEWKREWDKEKVELEDIKQTEPARRPVGRIGSGRFDRGDDERKKGESSGHVDEHHRGHTDKSPTKQRGEVSARGRGGHRPPETPPRMAGRGRGRGKAKSANEAKPQRVRSTSSGDERVVNCDSDLLVIKLDNTPGDNSVEVEYSDGELPKPTKQGGTASHGAQTEELWWDEDDDLTMSLVQEGLEEDDILQHRQLFEDADQGAHRDIVVGEDDDEWEDCDDDSVDKSQTSTDSREGQLKVNTQLNPDAPEFTPTSPLSPPSPRSPREKRQKVKHMDKTPPQDSGNKVQTKGGSEQKGTKKNEKNTDKKSHDIKRDQSGLQEDSAITKDAKIPVVPEDTSDAEKNADRQSDKDTTQDGGSDLPSTVNVQNETVKQDGDSEQNVVNESLSADVNSTSAQSDVNGTKTADVNSTTAQSDVNGTKTVDLTSTESQSDATGTKTAVSTSTESQSDVTGTKTVDLTSTESQSDGTGTKTADLTSTESQSDATGTKTVDLTSTESQSDATGTETADLTTSEKQNDVTGTGLTNLTSSEGQSGGTEAAVLSSTEDSPNNDSAGSTEQMAKTEEQVAEDNNEPEQGKTEE